MIPSAWANTQLHNYEAVELQNVLLFLVNWYVPEGKYADGHVIILKTDYEI